MDMLRSDLDNYLTSKINRTRYNNPDMLRFGFRENEGYGLSDIYVEAFKTKFRDDSDDPRGKFERLREYTPGKAKFQVPFNTAKGVALGAITLAVSIKSRRC